MFKLSGLSPEKLTMITTKWITVLLFLSVSLGVNKTFAEQGELREIILDQEDYSLEALQENNVTLENNQRRADLFNLQKAKFKIISGDLKTAVFYLNRISEKESVVTAIKKRYMAMIYFIQGRFDKSIKELNDKKLNNNNYYKQNCLLRLINFMATGDVLHLQQESKACQLTTHQWTNSSKIAPTQQTRRLGKAFWRP